MSRRALARCLSAPMLLALAMSGLAAHSSTALASSYAGIEATLPANASSNPGVNITSVSCAPPEGLTGLPADRWILAALTTP